MKIQQMLARLLSIAAIIGFIMGPMLTPPAWAVNAPSMASQPDQMAGMASMDDMSSMKGPMPCCPKHKPAVPSCPKDCPWAALCAAKVFSNTVTAVSHLFIASIADPIVPDSDQNLARMGEPPPPRPPRT